LTLPHFHWFLVKAIKFNLMTPFEDTNINIYNDSTSVVLDKMLTICLAEGSSLKCSKFGTESFWMTLNIKTQLSWLKIKLLSVLKTKQKFFICLFQSTNPTRTSMPIFDKTILQILGSTMKSDQHRSSGLKKESYDIFILNRLRLRYSYSLKCEYYSYYSKSYRHFP